MPMFPRAVTALHVNLRPVRLPLLFAAGFLLVLAMFAATPGVALAAETCIVDTGGPNDPSSDNQRDLTKLCFDPAGLPNTLAVKWHWDRIDFPGASVGDACALFDTDGNGNADYSLCMVVDNTPPNPTTMTSFRILACDDTTLDSCDPPITPVPTTGTICSASVQGTVENPADPFGAPPNVGTAWPADTVGACNINLANFGNPSLVTVLDVCSYTSPDPTNNPYDCVYLRPNHGKLEVRKVVSPTNDSGLFNLLIDGAVVASDVGNGGTTGETLVVSGTHTVAETAGSGTNLSYYNSSIVCRRNNGLAAQVASATNAGPLSVPVEYARDIVCTITNTRKVGALQVTKTVDWGGTSPDPAQTFQICITGPSYPTPDCQTVGASGGALTWGSLLAGVYTVTETPNSAWTATPSTGTVEVTGSGTATYSINNTRNVGSLVVTKNVNWNGVTVDPAKTFEICITGPSYATPNCQTIGANGGPLTWNSLIPGSYAVTETNPGAEWAVVITGSPVTVSAGGSATAAVTNTYQRSGLTVTKVVDWNGVTADPNATFNICITGPSFGTPNCQSVGAQGGAVNWDNLLPGEYVVTESDAGPLWTTTITGSPATVAGGGSGVSASVLNVRKRSSLAVTKVVDWKGIAPDTAKTFTVCIAGPSFGTPDCKAVDYDGGVLTWDNLIPGDYTISENDPGSEWTVAISSATVTVPADGSSVAASITNSRKLGSLQVTKTVNWNGVAADTAKTFEICITGPSFGAPNCKLADYDGGALLWDNLIPGSYTVSENNPGSEWETSISGSPATVPADGGQATAAVTNTRKLPPARITVTKQVTETASAQWSFILRLDDANAKTVTSAQATVVWENLTPNRSYVLSEDDAEGWAEGAFTCSSGGVSVGEALAGNNMRLTVAPGADVTCVKVNTDVSGAAADHNLYLPTIRR